MDNNFYKNLKAQNLSLRNLLSKSRSFKDVPESWYIVITDIENSSEAIAQNKHDNVNIAATGSIVTVLNTIKNIDKNAEIPYFFGGDGVSFIIPPIFIDLIFDSLKNYQKHVQNQFDLKLRIGKVKVTDIYKREVTLKIAKQQQNKFLIIPVVLGEGLKLAETIIKDEYESKSIVTDMSNTLNLEGMECRWDEIYPENKKDKVLCLLIESQQEEKQAKVFGQIIEKIDTIFGELEVRRPITILNLKLKPTFKKIKTEMYAKLGKYNPFFLLQKVAITAIGVYYFKYFPAGKKYVYRITQLSDTIMIDGSINTVVSGSQEQINTLVAYLKKLEKKQSIYFGYHATYASIMSCYVQDMDKKHIHFVDGTEGGYTSAAKMLKHKLNLHSK